MVSGTPNNDDLKTLIKAIVAMGILFLLAHFILN